MLVPDDNCFISKFKTITERLIAEGVNFNRFQCSPETNVMEMLKDSEWDAIVGATDTIIELGHPVTNSFCFSLTTKKKGLIGENQISVIGKDLNELSKGRHSVGLVLLGQVADTSDPTRRALLKHLGALSSIAGCMVRVAAHRIWIRFSQDALDRHLTLKDLGILILSELKKDGVASAEVILLTGKAAELNIIQAFAEELAEERAVRYQKALVEKMNCESGVDCDSCPENPTCKVLKAAVAVARRKGKL